MNIRQQLQRKEYFVNEYNRNQELKKWLSKDKFYVSFEIDKSIYYVEINYKDNSFSVNGYPFQTHNDNDAKKFLLALVLSYPNPLSKDFTDEFIKREVVGGSNKYFSKKKSMFVNRMDHFLQSAFGIDKKKLSQFNEIDRKIINFERSQTPSFNKNIVIEKVISDDFIGLIHLSRKLFKQERFKEAKEFLTKANLSFFSHAGDENFILKDYFATFEEFFALNKEYLKYIKFENIVKFHKKELDILKGLFRFNIGVVEFLESNIKNLSDKKYNKVLKKLIIEEDFIEIKSLIIKSVVNLINLLELDISIDLKFVNETFENIFSTLSEEDSVANFTRKEYITSKLNKINDFIDELLNYDEGNLFNRQKESGSNNNNTNEKSITHDELSKKFEIPYKEITYAPRNWNKYFKTVNEIKIIQKNVKEKWKITPDFETELFLIFGKSELLEEYMDSEVNYKYFFPPEAKIYAKSYKNKLNRMFPKSNIHFYEVKELSNIFKVFGFEIILYDPSDINSENHSGYYIDFFKSNEIHQNSKEISPVFMALDQKTLLKMIHFIETNVLQNDKIT